jgi:hypothetical protein
MKNKQKAYKGQLNSKVMIKSYDSWALQYNYSAQWELSIIKDSSFDNFYLQYF